MLVSLDLETTGLDERIHEAWEVALVDEAGRETAYQFPLRKSLDDASREALRIGGFMERHEATHGGVFWGGHGWNRWVSPKGAARILQQRTKGATLLGCAIQFDMRFLTELLRAYGFEPEWHHRGLDLGSFAAGALGEREPLRSAVMAERIVPNDQAHTALGDARWNWSIYSQLVNG